MNHYKRSFIAKNLRLPVLIGWCALFICVSILLSACQPVALTPPPQPSPAALLPTRPGPTPTRPQATPTTLSGTPLPARQRIRQIKDYVVFYGKGQAEAMGRYGLAIIQPDTLTPDELSALRQKGTLVVAYLSVGEAEPNRPWYTDGRVDPKWLLGKNENWGSDYVDASQPGWQKLMHDLTGEYLQQGFDGIFMDTVDTVDAFPKTKPGMLALIRSLRTAYPQALLVMNRGFALAEQLAPELDAIMFEDLSTTYNFETKEYASADNAGTAEEMVALEKKTGLPILALDYAPPNNPALAQQAVQTARRYGFIPAVSVINLDMIVDYGLDKAGPPDVRLRSLRVEGEEPQLTLVIQVENTGLSTAAGVPLLLRIDGSEFASLQRDLASGETFEWQVPWPNANTQKAGSRQGARISATALFQDATPLDNAISLVFTPQALGREPLLPPDQQRRRSNPNTPDLQASSLTAPPLIDGKLDEWKSLPCYDVNRADQISYGDPSQWSSPQDLSGRVCYAWDAANLYVAFQIKDDQLVQQNSGSSLWKGDHVELWFDTQLQLDFDSNTAGDDDFQLGVSPGDFQQAKPDFYIFAPALYPSAWRGQVEYAVVKTPDGYAGEVKLPAKVLKGLRLVADNTIGVSFEPSDTDTPGSSEQELMMSLAPRSSSQWGNPTNWNNLTLSR